MLQHPEIMRFLVSEHVGELRRSALAQRPAPQATRTTDLAGIELRLCRVGDDPALEQLAALAEQPLPFGRCIVALVDGKLVAAMPLVGGRVLADPFVRTAHLRPLLELRAAQLQEPTHRRGILPRSVSLIRSALHA